MCKQSEIPLKFTRYFANSITICICCLLVGNIYFFFSPKPLKLGPEFLILALLCAHFEFFYRGDWRWIGSTATSVSGRAGQSSPCPAVATSAVKLASSRVSWVLVRVHNVSLFDSHCNRLNALVCPSEQCSVCGASCSFLPITDEVRSTPVLSRNQQCSCFTHKPSVSDEATGKGVFQGSHQTHSVQDGALIPGLSLQCPDASAVYNHENKYF